MALIGMLVPWEKVSGGGVLTLSVVLGLPGAWVLDRKSSWVTIPPTCTGVIAGTLLPLQPRRKKKPHQIFRRAPTSLVNNHFSPPHPLTSPTFTDKSLLFICFP